MKKTTCLLLICLSVIFKTDAQSPPDSILLAAYNQTLQLYWDDLRQYWQRFNMPVHQDRLKLYSDFLKGESLTKENQNHYTIVQERDLYARCNRLIVSRKPELVYQINHANFQKSKDTIDILISERSFKCLRRKHVSIGVSCRGDMGYIPDARLILDDNKKWVFVDKNTLYEEALGRVKVLPEKQ